MIWKIIKAMDKHLEEVEKCKTLEEFNKLLPSRTNIIKQSNKIGYDSEATEFMYRCLSLKFHILSGIKEVK